jgi:hypothetical protein
MIEIGPNLLKAIELTSMLAFFLTIALDLQIAENQMATDPDEYFAQVGRDFVAMLEEME